MSVSTVRNAEGRRARLINLAAAAALVFAVQLLRGPASSFLYDGVQYWGGPLALLGDEGVSEVAVLNIRGVLTPLVYLVPAAASLVIGSGSAGLLVLVWNALLAAGVCVLLLPRLASRVAPGHEITRTWISAVLGAVLLSGFAPYPLLDVWSLAFAITALLLLTARPEWWTALLAGLAAAVAVDLRPSYLLPLALALIVLFIARPRSILWTGAGAVIGVLPQVLYNAITTGSWSPAPHATAFLVKVQSAQATYAIRYDTVLEAARHPQQWYCSPSYAALGAADDPPTSPFAVAGSLMSHLPDSIRFALEKIGATLRWSLTTPFEPSPTPQISAMALLVVLVVAAGAAGLIWAVINSVGLGRFAAAALLSMGVGVMGTVVLSTPETRFALPLAMIGIVGVLTVIPHSVRRVRRVRGSDVTVAAAGVALAALLLWAGLSGVAHPMPPGPMATPADCIELAGSAGSS
ncbi:hypothetical protein [Microbacterium rhizomatis]|uniref:Glycosyltransferase family 39 protein n=1 Tax=Microbacterium rhizomatis TaxID=1631477 RepID=A0A5J5J8Y0_9MICO|nr:hypothetical protein [Microbacterium rhizomatis]KAA9111238.1 hypothetical protein F6B43_06495 [Microbacterium rhizomatis]